MKLREGFLPVPGYDRYEVDKNGNGFVIGTDIPILWHKSNGYLFSKLVDNQGVRRSVGKHRAVALAYIPQPIVSSKLTVNHKDGDKSNNCLENLEWATYSENTKHAYENGFRTDNVITLVKNTVTGEEFKFNSKLSCAKYFGWTFTILSKWKKDHLKIGDFELLFIKKTKSPEEVYPLGIAARNIVTKQIIIADNASELSKYIGVHQKVIRKILRAYRFQYPTNGYDIRAISDELKWPTYTDEEINAYKNHKFIHQPIIVEYPDGKRVLVGSVVAASLLTKTPQRSIRFCVAEKIPCSNKFRYYKFTRTKEMNA